MENGHYTTDCIVSSLGEWYKFDDQYVSQTTELELCGKDAYILFYISNKVIIPIANNVLFQCFY